MGSREENLAWEEKYQDFSGSKRGLRREGLQLRSSRSISKHVRKREEGWDIKRFLYGESKTHGLDLSGHKKKGHLREGATEQRDLGGGIKKKRKRENLDIGGGEDLAEGVRMTKSTRRKREVDDSLSSTSSAL